MTQIYTCKACGHRLPQPCFSIRNVYEGFVCDGCRKAQRDAIETPIAEYNEGFYQVKVYSPAAALGADSMVPHRSTDFMKITELALALTLVALSALPAHALPFVHHQQPPVMTGQGGTQIEVHPIKLKKGTQLAPDGNGGYVVQKVPKKKFREAHPKVYTAYRKTRTACVRFGPIVNAASSVGSFVIQVTKL